MISTWISSRSRDPATGKSAAHTDTYHGRFVKLVPDEQVVEVMEFETANPAMRGEMTVTLTDADGGTEVLGGHENLPPASRPPTTRLAGGWPSRSSRASSKQA